MLTSSKPLSKRNFLVLSTLGYGLHIVLVSFVGWPGSTSMFVAIDAAPEDPFSPFMLAKNVAFCGAFLVWFLCSANGGQKLYNLFSGKALFMLFSGMVMVGILLSGIPSNAIVMSPKEIASGILMGVGVSGNFALWQHTLCARKTPVDAQGLIGGTALGAAFYFLLVWLPEWLVAMIALVVITPGTSILLVMCNRGPRGDMTFPSTRDEHRANMKKGVLSLLMPGLTIGAIGFVMQLIRLILSETTLPATLVGNLFSIALIFGAGIIAFIFERTRYRVNMDIFYRYGAPTIGLVLLFVPVLGDGYAFAAAAGLYTIFTIASIMAILACNQVARFYAIPPISIYALVFGVIYTARFVPVLLFGVLRKFGFPEFGVMETGLVTLFSVGLMFGVYVASTEYQRSQRKANVFSWESSLPHVAVTSRTLTEDGFEHLKKKKKLTNREFEILVLLQEGRNVPNIAKKLCVADNTVRYHCKNIYSKFDVHSRQELLDILEDEKPHGPAG